MDGTHAEASLWRHLPPEDLLSATLAFVPVQTSVLAGRVFVISCKQRAKSCEVFLAAPAESGMKNRGLKIDRWVDKRVKFQIGVNNSLRDTLLMNVLGVRIVFGAYRKDSH